MILKREMKDLLGKEVKFLTRGMNGPDKMDCVTGMFCGMDHDAAAIKRNCSVYYTELEHVFRMDEEVPAAVDTKTMEELKERSIQKYMAEMADTESLLRFPLLYNLHKSSTAWEAYKRIAAKVAGVNL